MKTQSKLPVEEMKYEPAPCHLKLKPSPENESSPPRIAKKGEPYTPKS